MLRKLAKHAVGYLPHHTQKRVLQFLSHVPLLNRVPPLDHISWTREIYTGFGRDERRSIFMSIARFAHINRPISGYYMEFGSHEGNTMRIAWDCLHRLFDWTFIAFDSFEGLPRMQDFDRSDIFRPGNLATGEEDFIRIVTAHGVRRERLRTVKGFYSESLTPQLRDSLQPGKAAVVYVDCDLYESTVSVLDFIHPFLQLGTIVVFDDWNCYHARPDAGERRAWREFLERNPELVFEDFVSTAEAKSFICVKN